MKSVLGVSVSPKLLARRGYLSVAELAKASSILSRKGPGASKNGHSSKENTQLSLRNIVGAALHVTYDVESSSLEIHADDGHAGARNDAAQDRGDAFHSIVQAKQRLALIPTLQLRSFLALEERQRQQQQQPPSVSTDEGHKDSDHADNNSKRGKNRRNRGKGGKKQVRRCEQSASARKVTQSSSHAIVDTAADTSTAESKQVVPDVAPAPAPATNVWLARAAASKRNAVSVQPQALEHGHVTLLRRPENARDSEADPSTEQQSPPKSPESEKRQVESRNKPARPRGNPWFTVHSGSQHKGRRSAGREDVQRAESTPQEHSQSPRQRNGRSKPQPIRKPAPAPAPAPRPKPTSWASLFASK